MQELQSAQQNAFADIKTMDDVVKLQAEDPFRFQAWQVQQMRLQAAKAETDRVTAEGDGAEQSNWAKHVQEENAKAAEFIPDLADKAKSEALTKRVATELLPELGFKDSELAELANGRSKLSIYDHRVQRLLADGLKLRDIQSAPKAVAAKPLPPVQKPGTSRPQAPRVRAYPSPQPQTQQSRRTEGRATATRCVAVAPRSAGHHKDYQMALPTNTLATYEAIGNREDLSNMIYRIDPDRHAVHVGIDKREGDRRQHEWQTQALAAARPPTRSSKATTPRPSGDPTVRLGNLPDLDKTVRVSGTQQAVHAGRSERTGLPGNAQGS
jgi:hypothetical protein